MKTWLHALLLTVLLAGFPAPHAPAQDKGKAQKSVMVKLDSGTENLHAAMMALKLADGMAAAGAKVTLFLNLESVRLADKRVPLDLTWGMPGGHSLKQLYDSFVKKGGTVMVCPMCAKNVGLEAKELREGAKMAASVEEISSAILAADKILSY